MPLSRCGSATERDAVAPGDLLGRGAAVGDGLDDRGGAADDVAAGEEAGDATVSAVSGVDGEGPVPLRVERRAAEEVEHRLLADGRDDRVGREDDLAPVDGHRPRPAGGVGLAELHPGAGEADDAAVLDDDAGRGEEVRRPIPSTSQSRTSAGSAGISARVRR